MITPTVFRKLVDCISCQIYYLGKVWHDWINDTPLSSGIKNMINSVMADADNYRDLDLIKIIKESENVFHRISPRLANDIWGLLVSAVDVYSSGICKFAKEKNIMLRCDVADLLLFFNLQIDPLVIWPPETFLGSVRILNATSNEFTDGDVVDISKYNGGYVWVETLTTILANINFVFVLKNFAGDVINISWTLSAGPAGRIMQIHSGRFIDLLSVQNEGGTVNEKIKVYIPNEQPFPCGE